MVISEQHPLVRKFRAANARFHDVVGLRGIVHRDFEMGLYGAGKAVGDRKAALPIFGSDRAIHIFKQRLGVVPGKRQGHEMRKRASLIFGNAFRAGQRSPAGSQRIAGNDEVIRNRAALNVRFRSPGPVGKHFALFETVLGGIGINEHGGDAIFCAVRALKPR